MNNTTFYRGQAYYIPAPNEICKKLKQEHLQRQFSFDRVDVNTKEE